MKILIVVTSVAMYDSGKLETGLWLSELTHIYHLAQEQGYDITIASTKGGNTPIDPESLKPMMLDKITKDYWADSSFRDLLQHTKSLSEVSGQQFDCVYLAGGHGTMYDFLMIHSCKLLSDNITKTTKLLQQYVTELAGY
jgi:putative intracellular protease/amidase